MQVLLSISIAMLAGLLMTRLFKKVKLPAVTAYLVAGVIIGPYCLGALGISGVGFNSAEDLETVGLISEVALGFIAFSIGAEFRIDNLKATGHQATIIGIVQALTATLLVDIALIAMHLIIPDKLTLPQAIVMGAIATATAPAATLMVVRQYKAKGELTSLLLPIVALDDAVGLVVFAVSFGIAKNLALGDTNMVAIIVDPILEIIGSLLLGSILGWLLTQVEKLFNSNANRLNISIVFVLLCAALSMAEFDAGPVHIGFSSLLTCMMMGTVFCNICPLSEDMMTRCDKWSNPVLALFFVISGASLELDVFTDILIVGIGVVYIIFRSLGKYFGAAVSARLTGCSESICKYLGITLLPQAGVALGMCSTAMALGEQGNLIRNITLFSVLVYELIGPYLTKKALTAAGDIKPMSEEVRTRRERNLGEAMEKRAQIRKKSAERSSDVDKHN